MYHALASLEEIEGMSEDVLLGLLEQIVRDLSFYKGQVEEYPSQKRPKVCLEGTLGTLGEILEKDQKDFQSRIFLSYPSLEQDFRPTETIPEDYYV